MKTILQTLTLVLFFTHISVAQWYYQSSGTTSYLYDITFIDMNTGYAVGRDGTIIHTTNGGENWSVLQSGTTVPLKSVYFTDENNGWIVEGACCIISPGGSFGRTPEQAAIILHTTNGGLT